LEDLSTYIRAVLTWILKNRMCCIESCDSEEGPLQKWRHTQGVGKFLTS